MDAFEAGAERDEFPDNGDCLVIPVSDALRRKSLVFDCTLEEGMERAVARANKVVEKIAREFDGWMAAEVDRVRAAHRAYAAEPGNAAHKAALFRAAHDLRGQAASLGYPLAGRIAQSLSRLLSLSLDPKPMLVAQHVEALRAVVREGAKDASDPVGAALAEELELLAEEALSHRAG